MHFAAGHRQMPCLFEYNPHEIAVGKQIAQDGGKCGAAGTHMQREDENGI